MTTARGPDGVLVVGDAQPRVLFASSADGTVLGTAALAHGRLAAAPLVWGTFAICGEGAATGASALHAFDVSATPIVDRWTPGLAVDASVDATPVLLATTLWAASSSGHLLPFDVADMAHPKALAVFDALRLGAGERATIASVLATGDGGRLLLTSQRGVCAVDIAGATPAVAWTALATLDLTAVTPLLDGDLLLVADGAMVHALAVHPSTSSPEPVWSYPTQGPVGRMLTLGARYCLILEQGGRGYVLDNLAAVSLATFTLPLATGAAAWTSFSGDGLVSLSSSGELAVDTLAVDADGTVVPSRRWTQQAPGGFAGPPIVSDGLAYGVGGDGSLRLFDIASKAVVFTAPLGAGSLASAIGCLATGARAASTGAVRFLLDGESFFPTLRDLLVAATAKSFVSPALPEDMTFEAMIKALGASGGEAYVMMWDSALAYATTDDGTNWTRTQFASTVAGEFRRYFTGAGAVRGDHRLNSQTYLALTGAPNVHSYLEPYDSELDTWYTPWALGSGSNHQKIVIVSVEGTKLALVSGFNVVTPSYYDTPEHPLTDAAGSYTGESWHDSGLLIQGDAVALVEAEFDRRWSKQGSAPAPGSTTYAKVAAWQIARGSCLDAPGTCGTRSRQPTPYEDRRITTPAVALRVAITNGERRSLSTAASADPRSLVSGVRQIREQLVAAIGAATHYAYLENYTFQDVAIAEALAARLSTPTDGFRAIVVVPHPTVGDVEGVFSMGLGQLELVRYAYAAVLLSTGDWTSATLKDGVKVTPADSVAVRFDQRGIEYTHVAFTKGSRRMAGIRDIASIDAATASPHIMFSSPARYFAVPPADTSHKLPGLPPNFRRVYVHSKLALFDDAVGVIGSANFSRRSMIQDGELSVFVHDATTVTSIRQRLFEHWGMTDAVGWNAGLTAFGATSTPSLGMLRLQYAALPTYEPTLAWSILTSWFDPSQVL